MATFAELVAAEKNGTIGPKSKAALEQYRKSSPGYSAPKLSWQDTSEEQRPGPPHSPNALAQMSGAVVGTMLHPPLKLGGAAGVGVSSAMGGEASHTFNLPTWAGGPVTVNAAQTPMQGLRQLPKNLEIPYYRLSQT